MSSENSEDHIKTVTLPDGSSGHLRWSDAERGSKGPFVPVDRSDGEVYGYFCSACRSIDTAMDTMGRIQCQSCGNLRKPTEWDAAHE